MILMGKQGSPTPRFQRLNCLIRRMVAGFQSLHTGLERKFIRKLQRYRKQGNASAHCITLDVTEEDLLEDQEDITFLTKFLFRLYRNIP